MSRKQKRNIGRVVALALLVAIPLAVADDLPDLGAKQNDPAMDSLENVFNEDGSAAPAQEGAKQASEAAEDKLVEQAPETAKATAAAPASEAEVDDVSKSLELDAKPAETVDGTAMRRAVTAVAEDSSVATEVTNLEFKHDPKSSQVIVRSNRKLRYTETKSAGTRQYIYLFENTATPEKFQRAYDTTEFASPVALFTLFQLPNTTPPRSKLIVQLREDQVPSIVESDRGLVLEFAASKSGEPRIVDTTRRDILSGDNIYAKGGTYSGDVIQRLEIKNSDVQDVIRLIARTSGYNVVIGEDVSGKIGTLSLTNIPWDQAFTLVLQSKHLGFVREGNVLRVGTTAALKSEKEEAAAVEKAQEALEPLKTVLLPISYAKVNDLVPRGRTFLTPRGTIEADTRTNTVIIKDIEKVVTRVQRLLQSLDMQPARVSISAKIVEMRSSLTRSLGLGGLTTSFNLDGTNNTLGTSFTTATGTGAFAATLTAPDYSILSSNLSLGELENNVKLLANPSVSVVANQQATISQSLSFFIPNTTIAAGAIVPGFTQITTSLNMSVTPIVSGDGSIFMTVAINNDIPTPASGQTTIASRNVSTQVLVENGDTAVIGGVFQNTVSNEREGIPFLMRIPLIGYLFSGNSWVDSSTEIFIFLTAKILNAEESFKRTL